VSVEVAGRWQPAREQRRDLTCPTVLRAGVGSWEELPCQTSVRRTLEFERAQPPNALTVRRAQPPHPAGKADFFSEAVHDAVDRVGLQCPDVLVGITFGIEDVPHFDMAWSPDQVPLAAALEATANQPGQVVVYRRPLEHRAVSRRGLRILVYRTIVEQLAALTGRSVEEIDPDGAGAEDD
jgi:hypothetical protein